jgi:hypothetical protein
MNSFAKNETRKRQGNPALRFSPRAWAKLVYLRDIGPMEIGGFAVSAADDLLYVEDIVLVRQYCGQASVEFDDEAVADYFDTQVDRGLSPAQFARIWVHTHPGSSPEPSATDEDTFERVFGRCDWAVMFILARGGRSYARLRFNVGPGGESQLGAEVDFSREFCGSDHTAWSREYLEQVQLSCEPPLLADFGEWEDLSSRLDQRLFGLDQETIHEFDGQC